MTFPTTTTEGDPLVTSDPVQLGKAILWVRECVPADQQENVLQMLGILPAPTLYCAAGTHVRTPANTWVHGLGRRCRACTIEGNARRRAAREQK